MRTFKTASSIVLLLAVALLLAVSADRVDFKPEYMPDGSQKPMFITHKVYLDIEVDDEPLGRIVLGLFGRVAPKAAANFAALADGTAGIGNKGKPLHYKGNNFHRIVPGMLA